MGIYYGDFNVKMYQRKDDVISFKGIVTKINEVWKEVVVDGETFRKRMPNSKLDIDVSDLLAESGTIIEYNFPEIGQAIKFFDWSTYHDKCINMMQNNYSKEGDVATLLMAFDLGYLPKEILNVFRLRRDNPMWWPMNEKSFCFPSIKEFKPKHANKHHVKDYIYRCLINDRFTFNLWDYGFNNSVFYDISTQTFIENIKNMPDTIIDAFKFCGFNISNKKDIVDNGVVIMNALIRAKKYKKRYRYETSKHKITI
jgi:hypothetical protein